MHAPDPHPPSAPSASPREPLSHPALTDNDKERIETWFEHDSRLTEVANQLGIGVLTLAAWAKQPHIREALNDVREIAHFRTETLRAEAEHASVNRLLSLVRFSNHEEIARRAAANILGQGLRRGAGPPPSACSSPPPSPTPPPRDPRSRRDDLTTPSIPTPRVPTQPIPTLPPVTPATSEAPNAPTSPTASTPPFPPPPFQISNLKLPSPPPRTPDLRESPTPSPPSPVPSPVPPPCLSVSVPLGQSPSPPLQPRPRPPTPNQTRFPRRTVQQRGFDLARQYHERNNTRPP